MAPVEATISADTSPVYAPEALSAQFSAPTPILAASTNGVTEAKWINGVQMITSQLGFSLANASFSSFAKAIPSWRVLFIFQFPATMFFLILFSLFKGLIKLLFRSLRRITSTSTPSTSNNGITNHRKTYPTVWKSLSNFCCPNGKFSSLSVNTYSSGISSSLHLFRIVPFLISINPGLERTIVFRVISSIWQKGYSAPVLSFHNSICSSGEEVRQ